MKKILSSLLPLALALAFFAPATFVNASSSTFNITGNATVTATATGFDVSLNGTASVTSPNPSGYGVSVIWDAVNSPKVCKPATFSFTGTDPLTTAWSATKTFTTAGTYTIKALIHHSKCVGAESGDAIITFTAVIPPEICLDGIDNDFDGLTDLADPDCAAFFPKITVNKIIVNDNGGHKTAGNFSFKINGGTATPFEADGSNAVTLNTGTYSVTEVADLGYTPSYSGDCTNVILNAGDSKTCTITNDDNVNTTPPTVIVSSNTVEATGSAGATATFTVNANDDLDGDISSTATCDYTSGVSIFPLGATIVTCQATDSSGNTGTNTGTITVVDTTPPVITLLGSSSVSLLVGDTYTDAGATATDIVDGHLTSSIVTVYSGTISTLAPGTYNITYNVSDSHGNAATQVLRTVTVSDVTGPVVTVPSQTIEATSGAGATATFTVSAIDDVDGDISSTVTCSANSGDTFPIGSTALNCQATDSSGNIGNGAGIVTVEDTTPPVITLTGGATVSLTVGDPYTDLGATASDKVDGDLTSSIVTLNSVNTSIVGTYTITYNVSDSHGNAAVQVTRAVTVSPVITECNDGTDNDGDGKVDANDPGCHSDGNASNTGSYVASDNDETDPIPPAQCNDGTDNDGDQKVDFPADPGCSSLSDNDETDPVVTPPSGGGGGGSGGGRAQCSDGVDNDGDGVADANDPNCHSDGNPNNPASYVPAITNESGGSIQGQVLGASTSCGIYVDKFLRKGYKNDASAVTKVQKFLNDYLKSGLKEDGKYGSKTESWVKKFQVAHSDKVLKPWGFKAPTGIFYLTTQTEVNNIMCPDLKLPIPVLIPIETNPLAPQKA